MLRRAMVGIALAGFCLTSGLAQARPLSPVAFERLWQAIVRDAQPLDRPRSVSASGGFVRARTVYRHAMVDGLAEAVAEHNGPRHVRIELRARGAVIELDEEDGRCGLQVSAGHVPSFSSDELRDDPVALELARLLGARARRTPRGR